MFDLNINTEITGGAMKVIGLIFVILFILFILILILHQSITGLLYIIYSTPLILIIPVWFILQIIIGLIILNTKNNIIKYLII